QLEALLAIGEEIIRELDLSALLGRIVQHTATLLRASSDVLYLWDEEAQVLAARAFHGHDPSVAGVRLRLGEGLGGLVAARRAGHRVADYRAWPGAHPVIAARTPIGPSIAEPLLYRDRLIGALAINRLPGAPIFGEADQSLLRLFAGQAAIAIETARVHEAARRREAEAEALLRASRSLAFSLDADQVLRAIVQQAAAISGAPIVRLFVLDPAAAVLRCRVGVGFPLDELAELAIPVGTSLSGVVATTRAALNVADTRTDPRTYYPEHVEKYGVVSYLGLPVQRQDRLFGVLVFNTPEPRTYTGEEIGLLEAFAQHAAIALENARLHEAVSRRAEQLTTLTGVTQALMRSQDVAVIIGQILAAVQQFVPGAAARVWDVSDGGAELQLLGSRGLRETLAGFVDFRRGQGLAGLAAESRKPTACADLATDPRYLNKDWAAREGLASAIVFPLVAGDAVQGVLAIFTRYRHEFTAAEQAILQALADHAAIALENARLQDAVRRHAEQLEARVQERTAELERALRVKAEFFAKMSHELRTPLNFVLGFSEVLREGSAGPLSPRQAQFVERIHLGGRHLLDLIDDMLDATSAPEAPSGLRLEPVPLAALAEDALEFYGVWLVEKRLGIRRDIPPELTVVAERRKLAQVVAILLATAIRGAAEGTGLSIQAGWVEVAAPAAAAGQEGLQAASPLGPAHELEIAVEHRRNHLLPPCDLEGLFLPPGGAEGDPAAPRVGKPASLALAGALVRLHGGRGWVEHAPDGAIRFVVRLPRLELPPPRHVLVAGGPGDFVRALSVFLQDTGHRVRPLEGGAEALAAIPRESSAVIVVTGELAGAPVREFLRRRRRDPAAAGVPLLVIAEDEQDAGAARELGADEALVGPPSAAAVADLVRRLGERKSCAVEPPAAPLAG
ncbi:MAG: GAF domain-containing protein, partial [Candidatus Methylomirabilales bacterium]